MASACVLYMLALDNPVGNEISCVASKTDQARIVLDTSRKMARKSQEYIEATGVEVREHKIVHESSDSFARPLSSDDKSLDGLNDILAVLDELHAVPRDLFDVIKSGMNKRNDSLMLCITTAGMNNNSVGYSRSQYAKRICKGELQDDQLFSIVYTIDETDDPWEESSWVKANPNYGKSVDPINFAASAKSAKNIPSEAPSFLAKNLNIWLSQGKSFFDMPSFDKCIDKSIRFEDFVGQKCYVGIDLATVNDLCVRAFVFREDGIYTIFTRTYIAQKAFETQTSNKEVYLHAKEEGALIVMPGEVIDLEEFQKDFVVENKTYKISQALYDPMNATQFGQMCQKENVEMLEFRQNLSNFSEPTKKLDALIRQNKIRWNGNSLTKWNFGNVVVKPDAAGNVRPLKPSETDKIDEVVAIVMALAP